MPLTRPLAMPAGAGVSARSAPRAVLAELVRYAELARQLARPRTMALVILQGALAYGLVSTTPPSPVEALAAAIALVCWYAHGVALNDLSDVATDRINLRGLRSSLERPLVNGSGSRRDVMVVAWTLFAAGVLASVLISPWLLIVCSFMLALNLAYSLEPIRLSGRGGLAQAVLPLGYVVVPAVYAIALAGWGWPSGPALGALAGLYVQFVGRLMLKDLRDVGGDRQVGKRTFVIRRGVRTTVWASGVASIGGALTMLGSAAYVLPVARTASLAAVLVVFVVGTVAGLVVLDREPQVRRQVLLAGVVGRVATGWVFCCLVALTARMPDVQAVVLVAVGAIMFATACRPILEELEMTLAETPARRRQSGSSGTWGWQNDVPNEPDLLVPPRAHD